MKCAELLLDTDNRVWFGRYRRLGVLRVTCSCVPDKVRDRAMLGKQECRDQEKSAGEPAYKTLLTICACHTCLEPEGWPAQ